MQKFWKFRRGGGGKFWEPILENPEGRGVIRQIPSVGGVWIFSGTTQCKLMFFVFTYQRLKDKKLRGKLKSYESQYQQAAIQAAKSELLLTEQPGYKYIPFNNTSIMMGYHN